MDNMPYLLPTGKNAVGPPVKKGRLQSVLRYFGPAFVVSVAYIDPGNFATNISSGSTLNYALLWVILWSNLTAIFLQTMSAKLGIATGRDLPELCSETFKRKTNWIFWLTAEFGAMATDLAEFLGGSLGIYLLFHLPMWLACVIAGALTYLICFFEKYGQKKIEMIITSLVAVIGVAYLIEIFLARPDWHSAAIHTLIPSLPGHEAVTLAVGILGATVMPHVIYLHSHLVKGHGAGAGDSEKKRRLKWEKIDIAVAMNIAFFVNAAMLIVSASVFFKSGVQVNTIEDAHRSLEPMLGALSSGAFGIALLASGLSSSAVGTMAGQTIMRGFVGLSIPIPLRRLITMMPALAIILAGVNPMQALIWSQVVLCFILPVPIIQMLLIARKRELMGSFVNSRLVQAVGAVIAAVVIAFNILLLIETFLGATGGR